MADKLMKAQVTIPLDNAIPADYITNTFYFDGDDTLGEDTDAEYHSAVQNLLTTFYQAIDQDLFPESISSPATVKVYDMRDALPRVPELTFTIALTPSVNRALPHETAICLSFQGDPVSGVTQARRRGRVFLGPLAQSILTTDPGPPYVSSTIRTTIANAAATLENGLDTAVGSHVSWAVYSPTLDVTETIDDAFNDVTNGWVDNAFDTQRRRGQAPTARTTWT
jgi:hypothetical protein